MWPSIISSFLTTGIIGIIIFVGRHWLLARLTKGIQHEYNSKLENIRSDLRKSESEIGDVRKAIMDNIAFGQTAVTKRRLQAIDDLWAGLLEAKKNSMAVNLLAPLKLEALAKEIHQPNIKTFIDAITAPLNLKKPQEIYGEASKKASRSQPWVGPTMWSVYNAYVSIVSFSIVTFIALKNGVYKKELMNNDNLSKNLKEALPSVDIDWNNISPAVFPTLLETLEIKLLQEIEKEIFGKMSDEEVYQRAVNLSNWAMEANAAALKEDKEALEKRLS